MKFSKFNTSTLCIAAITIILYLIISIDKFILDSKISFYSEYITDSASVLSMFFTAYTMHIIYNIHKDNDKYRFLTKLSTYLYDCIYTLSDNYQSTVNVALQRSILKKVETILSKCKRLDKIETTQDIDDIIKCTKNLKQYFILEPDKNIKKCMDINEYLNLHANLAEIHSAIEYQIEELRER